MTTSRYQGHCWTSALEDDDRDDAVIMPQTASVTPLAGNIPSTPPRNKQVLGLVTPLATPDSRSRLNSSEIRFTSPPHTPVQRPDIPKDTKPLTISGNPSAWSSDQSTTVPFLPLTGLLTPDNTPPRLSKPRSVPISHKEETTDRSESSLSLEITSTVVKTSETSELHAEVIQNTRISEPVTTQCNGITKKTKRRCFKSVKAPNCYCIYHIDQDTGPPSNSSVNVRGPQRRQSQDTVVTPTRDVNSQCHGLALRGTQCQRSVKPPVQYCYQHGYQSNNTPTTSIAPQPTTEVDSQCHELTLHGIQCRPPVKSPVQYHYQHGYQGNNTLTTPIAPTLTIEVNSRCHGLTLRGIQCRRSIKPPAQYCHQHESQSTNTPTTPIAPKPTTDVNSQCRGLTLRGVQCRRSVKRPAQYCHQHGSQSTNTPTAPKPTTDVNSQCRGLTLRTPTTPIVRLTVQCNAKSKSKGRRCQQRVSIIAGQLTKDSSQLIYCRYHIPAPVGIVTHADNEGFKVQQVGREEVFVHFCDYIPEYLQPDTQKRLRNAITREISERFRIPGYVYALNVFDPEIEGKLSLKIGYSNDVKKRHAEWKNKCRSSIKDVRGWWPGTIIEAKDDNEMSIQELIGNNRQGAKGPMAEHLERLVHIELNDLATHAPYLHPNFPDVHFSDVPRLPKAAPKPCRDCNGTKHQEVFSFTRVKEGEFFGREWEDIIKPVIRKWGLFLMEYFAPI
ncbi:hypothetical protein F4604DRAFT_309799 [Suillus subluteus]|nr:hypothetical protein F4604DRAFT_309799 [Suillus subluteus]